MFIFATYLFIRVKLTVRGAQFSLYLFTKESKQYAEKIATTSGFARLRGDFGNGSDYHFGH